MMTIARLKLPAAAAAFILLLAAIALTFSRAQPPGAARAPAVATQPSVATTAPATQVAAENSPKDVVLATYRAAVAGDGDAMIRRFASVTPQQAITLHQIAALMAAANDLNAAVRDKFGADMEQQFANAIGTGVLLSDITDATETITGDTAIVDIGSGPDVIPCVKVGSTWKISRDVLDRLNLAAVRRYAIGLPMLKQLATDIRAGKYKDINELRQAMAAMGPSARGAN